MDKVCHKALEIRFKRNAKERIVKWFEHDCLIHCRTHMSPQLPYLGESRTLLLILPYRKLRASVVKVSWFFLIKSLKLC